MIIKTVLKGINEIEQSTGGYTKELAVSHCTLNLYMTDAVYATLNIAQLLNSYVTLTADAIDESFRNYEVKSVTYIKDAGGGGSSVTDLTISLDDRRIGELIDLGDFDPYEGTTIPLQNYKDNMQGASYVTPITSLYIGEGFVTSPGATNPGGTYGIDIYDDTENRLDQILGYVSFETGVIEGRFYSDLSNMIPLGTYSNGTITFDGTINSKFPLANKLYFYFVQDYNISSGSPRTIVGGRRPSTGDPAVFDFPIEKLKSNYNETYMSFENVSGDIIVYKTIVSESGDIKKSDDNSVIGNLDWVAGDITPTLPGTFKTLTIVDAHENIGVDDSIIRLDGEQILDKTDKPYLNEAYEILKTYPGSVIIDENRIRVPKVDDNPQINSPYYQIVGEHPEPQVLYPNTVWEKLYDGESVTVCTDGALAQENRLPTGIQLDTQQNVSGILYVRGNTLDAVPTGVFTRTVGLTNYQLQLYSDPAVRSSRVDFNNSNVARTSSVNKMRNVLWNMWIRRA